MQKVSNSLYRLNQFGPIIVLFLFVLARNGRDWSLRCQWFRRLRSELDLFAFLVFLGFGGRFMLLSRRTRLAIAFMVFLT